MIMLLRILKLIVIAILITMALSWAVIEKFNGKDRSGLVGDIAFVIGLFPSIAESVFEDIQVDLFDNYKMIRVPRMSNNLNNYSQIGTAPEIDLKGLLIRSDEEKVARAYGWRVLVGAFTLNNSVKHAALYLSPELEVARVLHLDEEPIGGKNPRPTHRKLVHGLEITKDGSVIFAIDNGISLQRFNACGERIWSVAGDFHHAVALEDDEQYVWALNDPDITPDIEEIAKMLERRELSELIKIDASNGDIVKRISMEEIILANPNIDILEVRHSDDDLHGTDSRSVSTYWLPDPFHLNDVEPLPEKLAAMFKGFEAGDLLISARSLNLIFVIDPDTLKVKWWRMGATKRQHDPDWGRNGRITAFDNRMGRDYSRIVSIHPESLDTEVLYDGEKNNFYTRIRGKHQITDKGGLLITSPQQGRVFEVDASGEEVLEIINTVPSLENFNYVLSQAIWISGDEFKLKEESTCR